MRIRILPLHVEHDRESFHCGEESVDRFLKRYARQRQQRKLATTMVAIDADGDPNRIVGYYVLVPHEFRGRELPDPYRQGSRLGNLSAVPGALLAQLGVDLEFQHQGSGAALVSHALRRVVAVSAEYGCAAVVTDPIDERAGALYARFDFQPLRDNSTRLILMIETLIRAQQT